MGYSADFTTSVKIVVKMAQITQDLDIRCKICQDNSYHVYISDDVSIFSQTGFKTGFSKNHSFSARKKLYLRKMSIFSKSFYDLTRCSMTCVN